MVIRPPFNSTNTRCAELLDRAAVVIPGGVNTSRRKSEPRVCVARGSGAYLDDVDGRRFIDYHAAYGAVLLGHSYPEVTRRIRRAVADTVLFGLGVTEAEVVLAERLVSHIPSADQALLCNSGSEATYHALRLARAVTGRESIIKFQGCYHGFHDYVLYNVLSDAQSLGKMDLGSKGMLRAAEGATVICRFNDLDDVARAFRSSKGDIAAVIVEPIAHNAPSILPQDGFLEGLRTLCDEHESVLIFDEVITGFRHGLGGYQEIAQVRPDVTTLGKALGNGYPIAAVAGRADLMKRFNTHAHGDVHFAGTYNGNSVAVAAALATVEALESLPVHEHIYRLGAKMRDGLKQIAARADTPATVNGFGSVYILLFMSGPLRSYEDALRNDDELLLRYRRELIARGVFEMPERLGRNHISFSHTEDDVDRSLEAAELALRAALDSRGRERHPTPKERRPPVVSGTEGN